MVLLLHFRSGSRKMAEAAPKSADQLMFQAAKTKLDRTFDLLKSELQANTAQHETVIKATQTLEKASQILRRLVRKIWDEDDCRTGTNRSSKKRHENEGLFCNDTEPVILERNEPERDQVGPVVGPTPDLDVRPAAIRTF